jgi:type I restriction enzyme S subunit
VVSEWKEYTVQQLVDAGMLEYPMDGNHGEIHPKIADFVPSGIPFVMASDLINGHVDYNYCKYISESTASNLRKGFAKKGDVLLTHKATIGRTAIVDEAFNYIILTPQVTYYRVIKDISNHYLKYYFNSDYFLDTFTAWADSGSTRMYLGITEQRKLPIVLPDYCVQCDIAEVLSPFDDKIDLLTRQNATLESLTQTYFQQWFLGSPDEAWEEKGLDGIADFLNGLALQKYPYAKGNPQYVIKIKELNNGYSDSTDLCSTDVPEKYIVHAGDVIFSWSGSLTVDIWKYESGALNQHLFKVTSDKYPKWFYYHWIKYHLPEFKIIAESKATTMGHIQRGHLTAAKVLVPSEDEIEDMDKTMSPLVEKIERNNAQILTLQKLRDTLLPKLISGEVRVKQ